MRSTTNTQVQLALATSLEVPVQVAPWIGPLVVLGSRAARYSRQMKGRQLVIAVSVPRSDYAATLIGCGWVLASKPPALPEPLVALRAMKRGQTLRAVNSRFVITGSFNSLDETVRPQQAQFAGSRWKVDSIRAIAPVSHGEPPMRSPRPEPGSIEHMAGLDLTWDARLARPAADLAIVGTKTWLEKELGTSITRENDGRAPSEIGSILMPQTPQSATWYTRFFSASRLDEGIPIPPDVNAVVLDGNGAIKHLIEIESPVVFCVLDRSVADETATEMLMQLRNTRGEPFSLTENLGWSPPTGVEALGFTVAL